jgi:predicted kinase
MTRPERGEAPDPRAPTPATPLPLSLPEPYLVVLVGPAGCGKTTFAARHFAPDTVVSSDALREAIAGDAGDQSRNRVVFETLHREVERRLAAGRTTVVDATNVERHARRALVRIAERAGLPAVAIVFDLPLPVVLARNAARGKGAAGRADGRAGRADGRATGRVVPAGVVEHHHRQLETALARVGRSAAAFAAAEGFAAAVLVDGG